MKLYSLNETIEILINSGILKAHTTNKETVYQIINKKSEPEIKSSEEAQKVFEHWNTKQHLITHRNLNKEGLKQITKHLKDYSLQEMMKGIDNYNAVLGDKTYFFKYSWSIAQFFQRKNGFVEFLDDGGSWVSYCRKTNKTFNSGSKKNQSTEIYDFLKKFE